jgi:hypothetical protein
MILKDILNEKAKLHETKKNIKSSVVYFKGVTMSDSNELIFFKPMLKGRILQLISSSTPVLPAKRKSTPMNTN